MTKENPAKTGKVCACVNVYVYLCVSPYKSSKVINEFQIFLTKNPDSGLIFCSDKQLAEKIQPSRFNQWLTIGVRDITSVRCHWCYLNAVTSHQVEDWLISFHVPSKILTYQGYKLASDRPGREIDYMFCNLAYKHLLLDLNSYIINLLSVSGHLH